MLFSNAAKVGDSQIVLISLKDLKGDLTAIIFLAIYILFIYHFYQNAIRFNGDFYFLLLTLFITISNFILETFPFFLFPSMLTLLIDRDIISRLLVFTRQFFKITISMP